jgi:hypothetical protein
MILPKLPRSSSSASIPLANRWGGRELTSLLFRSNRAALASSLIKAQVISSGATWDAFALAFNSSPLSNLIDVGNTPVESKVSSQLDLRLQVVPDSLSWSFSGVSYDSDPRAEQVA